jgi:hypothetical protein
LVEHGSGGGIFAQYVLDKGMCRAAGMALVAAIPNSESKGVFWNGAMVYAPKLGALPTSEESR